MESEIIFKIDWMSIIYNNPYHFDSKVHTVSARFKEGS